jgi:hypothetical protein
MRSCVQLLHRPRGFAACRNRRLGPQSGKRAGHAERCHASGQAKVKWPHEPPPILERRFPDRGAGGDRIFARLHSAEDCRAVRPRPANGSRRDVRLFRPGRSGCGVALRHFRHGPVAAVAGDRQKEARRARTAKNPSQLSRDEKQQEVDDNLAAVEDLQEAAPLPDDLKRQLQTMVTRVEEKQAAQKLEIVAFGTISSGKSSLLNALAGRDAFQTDPSRRDDARAAGIALAGRRPGAARRYAGTGRGRRGRAGRRRCSGRSRRGRGAAGRRWPLARQRAQAAGPARRDGKADSRLPEQGRLVRRG